MRAGACVIAWPGAEAAAQRIATALDAEVVTLQSRRFPDGERYLRVMGEVARARVVIVAHLVPPDAEALGLMFLADALREQGAAQVLLVLPYLPYMRQDARFHAGEAVTAPSFARFVSGFADGLVTVDPHLHRIAALGEVYRIPTRAVSSANAIAQWVRAQVPQPVILGPDEESAQWVAEVANRVGCAHRVLRKLRMGDREVRIGLPPLQDLAGHTPVLLDDIVSSGHTMATAVRCLREAGLPRAVCIAVHGLFAEGARALLAEAGAGRVLTCNTLPSPEEQIDVLSDVATAVEELLRS